MTNWIGTLGQFSAAIRSGAEFAPGAVSCPHYPAARGLEVYRNNYRGNLHDTLAAAYPVLRQLVGEDFFRLLARRYIERHASRSGNLHHYGSEMAGLLTDFENTQHLEYLPDVARLEWAVHRAYFAEDLPAFDLGRLAAVAPAAYADLRWRLHPGCTMLASPFPVAEIWRAHQDGLAADFHFDLTRGGNSLLVYRNGLHPEILTVSPDHQYWLSRLQTGGAMGAATEATLARHPDFDLATALHHWLAQGVLADFHFSPEEKP
jgi:hypothetical protein